MPIADPVVPDLITRPKPEPILPPEQVTELTNRAIQIFDAGGAARRFPDRQSWIDFCITTAEKHVVEDR